MNYRAATHTLETVGPEGQQYTFIVEQQSRPDPNNADIIAHHFNIKESVDSFNIFQFSVLEDHERLRVIQMAHNDAPELKGRRIPDQMIRFVNRLFNKTVVSSDNKKPESGDFRSDKATRVWQRLVDSKEADYNEELDFYFFPVQE